MRAADELSREFLRNHPADAALVLENLPVDVAAALLEGLPPTLAAVGLRSLVPLTAATCLAMMADTTGGRILTELPPDAAVAVLRAGRPEERERLLSRTPSKVADSLRRRLRYPEGTAGASMDSHVLSFPAEATVSQALTRIQRSSRHAHYYLYIVDRDGVLVGVLNLRDLMLARAELSLASLMKQQVERISASAGRAEILAHPAWRGLHALPVVDAAGRFIGVVRHETLKGLELEQAAPRESQPFANIGMAFAELCWIGMTICVASVATALSGYPRDAPNRLGGDDESQP